MGARGDRGQLWAQQIAVGGGTLENDNGHDQLLTVLVPVCRRWDKIARLV